MMILIENISQAEINNHSLFLNGMIVHLLKNFDESLCTISSSSLSFESNIELFNQRKSR